MNSQDTPTLWVALTAVFAIAALGLGIWAFSLKSDRDDAQATVDRQQQELASQQQGASKEEAGLTERDRQTRAAYLRVRRSLIAADRRDTDFKAEVAKQADELTQARDDVKNADGADQKATAQLREARKARELSVACAQGTVDIIDGFLDASAAGARHQRRSGRESGDEEAGGPRARLQAGAGLKLSRGVVGIARWRDPHPLLLS